MEEAILNKVNSMKSNYEILRGKFRFTNTTAKQFIALQYTIKNKPLNIEKIETMKNYIKKQTKFFTPFSGDQLFIYSALLPLISEDPEKTFDHMHQNISALKKVGFKSSTYHPSALYSLETIEKSKSVQSLLIDAKGIYDNMKKNHPFLTSGDDYALCILMAQENTEINLLEKYYKSLNRLKFSKSNGLQALSHILAINSHDVEKDSLRVKEIYDLLKAERFKTSSTYYPVLGVISLLKDSPKDIVAPIVEIIQAFKGEKGFKLTEKGTLILIAATIYAHHIIESHQDDYIDNFINVTLQGILSAQQAAMIAAISASTAATAAH